MVDQNQKDEKNIVAVNKLIYKQENGPGSHQPPIPTLTRDEILKRVREGKKFQEINILSLSKMVQGLIPPKI